MPISISNNFHKTNTRIKSSYHNKSSCIEESINQKCNYLILKYNEEENIKKKKLDKINIDDIAKSINNPCGK